MACYYHYDSQPSLILIFHPNLSDMSGQRTMIANPHMKDENPKCFNFDYSYDSSDPKSPVFATQRRVYEDIGIEMLNHSFDGYNVCIFAYGQTGMHPVYT